MQRRPSRLCLRFLFLIHPCAADSSLACTLFTVASVFVLRTSLGEICFPFSSIPHPFCSRAIHSCSPSLPHPHPRTTPPLSSCPLPHPAVFTASFTSRPAVALPFPLLPVYSAGGPRACIPASPTAAAPPPPDISFVPGEPAITPRRFLSLLNLAPFALSLSFSLLSPFFTHQCTCADPVFA